MPRQRVSIWLIGVLAIIAGQLVTCSRENDRKEEADKSSGKVSERVSKTSAGDPLLQLELTVQARIGLRTQALAPHTMQPEIIAYGRLEEDPSRSFTLRAPIAGTLHFAAGRHWPSIGQWLADNDLIGMIEPRLVPTERIGLTHQLAAARSEFSTSSASVTAARAAFERAKLLNADNKNFSDRMVEEAAARLKAEEARLQAATDIVRLLENSLLSAGPTDSKALTVERGGEVVETLAQPGESIEPGSPILRVARLDRLLARIDVPVGQHIPPSVSTARIVPVGYEDQPIAAERVALAAAIDAKGQGESFLFRLKVTQFGLRPGVAVTAYLKVPGPRKQGVVIPHSALVRVTGKVYVYAQTARDQLVRKEVSLDSPLAEGYFVTRNISAGDRVVVEGAQILLSEEFKSRTAVEE